MTTKKKEKKTISRVELEKQGLDLINEALTKPGNLSECYKQFHRFSTRNRHLASMQAGLTPIATYKQWQEKGRQVKKGSLAITLMMPFVKKIEAEKPNEEDKVITCFMYRNNWFSYDQTEQIEGMEPAKPEPIPGFDIDQAIKKLEITEEKFLDNNGNCQGYCYDQTIAINPMAENPFKTKLHEMAHILLGHTKEVKSIIDTLTLEIAPREVEAETVTYIVAATLGESEKWLKKSRGYIQHWLKRNTKDKIRINKILSVADKILNAGACKGGQNDN